jgi:hypothetical protein
MTVVSPAAVEFEQPRDYRDEITARPNSVRFLIIPERQYLTIEGTGTPGGAEFAAAMGSLYPVAYTLHFALKKHGIEAPVGVLEGLFWLDTPVRWRLLLPVPPAASNANIADAIEQVRVRKSPPTIERLQVEHCGGDYVGQILHVGPYDAESATIEALHVGIESRGLRLRGTHHEIYISDPTRTAAARLKTVIRQPVEVP